MATVEERISLLEQQVTTMMAGVTTLQPELAGSEVQFGRAHGEAGDGRSKDQEDR